MKITDAFEIFADCVAKQYNLDYSPKSLEIVDSILEQATQWKEEVRHMIVASLGCYVGAVLIRETGGRWCEEAETSSSLENLSVEVPSESGIVTANPFVRCQKRIRNGKADGIAVWAKFVMVMNQKPTKVAEVGQKS